MKNPRFVNFHPSRIWESTAYVVKVHGQYVPVFHGHKNGCWVMKAAHPLNHVGHPGVLQSSNPSLEMVRTLAMHPKAEWFATIAEIEKKYPMALLTRDTSLDIK